MKDSKELHEPFLKDFKALLKKYNSYFNMEFYPDDGCSQPTIQFPSDEDRYYSQLNLENYIDGK